MSVVSPRARIAVLDDYMGVAHKLADWQPIQAQADLVFFTQPFGNNAQAAEALQDFDAVCLLRERMPVSAELLARLPRLKLIVATGRENRTLDHAAAQTLGIAVHMVSGSGNGLYATVELAWGLIIAAMRHLPHQSHAMTTAGAWQTQLGQALYGRTLGLVGLGKLGSRMALIAQAFGMKTIAWSPNLTAARAVEAGATAVSKPALFSTADIISLHLVLGPTTRGIVGQAELAAMRPDAILVNTARGPLIDETALIETLKAGRIRAAALDVYDQEPLPADHPLRTLPNTILTPHLGYSVEETLTSFYKGTAATLNDWLATR